MTEQREIKFRAKFNGEWIYWQCGDKSNWFWEQVRNYKLPVYQFTGLKDKNGVEIFEGDLLKVEGESGNYNCFEVFYHDNDCIGGQNIGFCINRMHTQGNSAGGRGYKFTPNSIHNNRLIVCGNIYENPELLND